MHKIFSTYFFYIAIFILAINADNVLAQPAILHSQSFKHYIDTFNANDEDLYKEKITNKKSWKFLSENIPLLECPNKNLEQTYYFRWWTYRTHIKKTKDGYIITEFLPNVPWAGKDNAISCAAALHFYEGRWLHNQKFLNSYADYWFHRGGNPRSYSFWPADAIYNYFLVTGKDSLCKALLPDLIKNYKGWENEKLDSCGLFWQVDDRDGMEMSVCGNGYRPTINSYLFGEAKAISSIAMMMGEKSISNLFKIKSKAIKAAVQRKLWDKNSIFFKTLPRKSEVRLCGTRELNGYTPWYFNLPDSSYSRAWKFLMNPQYFYAPFGPTTVEQCDPGFKISYEGHECQWNGPSWPYATSITLTGLANLINNYDQNIISKEDYYRLLTIYAKSQKLIIENGKTIPWIDEDLNPYTGDWISRSRLKTWDHGTWSLEKGGVERGRDYNHSTFCDLIITGLIGIRPQPGNTFILNPLIPQNTWDYFCLDNVLYHNKIITVVYDKTGKKYKKGKGLMVFVNGKKIASSNNLSKIRVTL